jgi:NitT/TauT family transport system ATP-binding protein
VYDIDLPRERTLDMMASPEFGAYTKLVRAHFFSQGILDH